MNNQGETQQAFQAIPERIADSKYRNLDLTTTIII